MDITLLLDPLFRLPLITGLLLAGILPVLGALLMLRDEWLAALGLAHLAAAGAMAGLAAGLPAVAGGMLAAITAGGSKTLIGARGNAVYVFMMLLGWCTTLLIGANSGLGDAVGHALMEGQLYFATTTDLIAASLLCVVAAISLPWLMPRLLRARLFPHHETANRLLAWRWHLGFDLLAAASMAVGTANIGLMAAFTLVFIPAWIAFRVAPSWRWTLLLCALIGIGGYLSAFALALTLDQPFGPVLVVVLLAVAAFSLGRSSNID